MEAGNSDGWLDAIVLGFRSFVVPSTKSALSGSTILSPPSTSSSISMTIMLILSSEASVAALVLLGLRVVPCVVPRVVPFAVARVVGVEGPREREGAIDPSAVETREGVFGFVVGAETVVIFVLSTATDSCPQILVFSS